MIIVHFVQPDGSVQDVEADVGMTVMEVAREANVPGILAECGGGAICSTCHVHIAPDWLATFPEREATEDMLLEMAPGKDETSRLSCQIELTAAHAGLPIRVPEMQSDY